MDCMHVRTRTMRLIYHSRRRLPIMRWLADGVMSFWLCFAAFSHSFSRRVTASRCSTKNNTDSWRTETQAALPQSLSRAITRIFCMDLSLVKKFSEEMLCYCGVRSESFDCDCAKVERKGFENRSDVGCSVCEWQPGCNVGYKRFVICCNCFPPRVVFHIRETWKVNHRRIVISERHLPTHLCQTSSPHWHLLLPSSLLTTCSSLRLSLCADPSLSPPHLILQLWITAVNDRPAQLVHRRHRRVHHPTRLRIQ